MSADDKQKIVLKFLNKILVNIGKEEIEDLTDFKDIKREDLLKQKNIDLIETMEKEIFKCFKKGQIDYHRKKTLKTYLLTLIKRMVSHCGFEFRSHRKDINQTVDGELFRRTYTIYEIIKI